MDTEMKHQEGDKVAASKSIQSSWFAIRIASVLAFLCLLFVWREPILHVVAHGPGTNPAMHWGMRRFVTLASLVSLAIVFLPFILRAIFSDLTATLTAGSIGPREVKRRLVIVWVLYLSVVAVTLFAWT